MSQLAFTQNHKHNHSGDAFLAPSRLFRDLASRDRIVPQPNEHAHIENQDKR